MVSVGCAASGGTAHTQHQYEELSAPSLAGSGVQHTCRITCSHYQSFHAEEAMLSRAPW